VRKRNANLKRLGQYVRTARKQKGWSQEDLAEAAQLDRSYVGGIERGERNISFTILCKLSKALKCTVGQLCADLPVD
jgi:transcriptional regulator with XRE-family HTH domain